MPQAFISYSRKDSEFVFRLVKDLKHMGYSIWFDQLDIRPGTPWDDAIDQALLDCQYVILVVSVNSMKPHNVKDEYSYALDNGITLVPILIEDVRMPVRIHRLQYIDFRKDYAKGFKELESRLPISFDDNDFSVSNQRVNTKGAIISEKNIQNLTVFADINFDERVALWANAIHPINNFLLFGGIGGALNMWDFEDGRVLEVAKFNSIYNLRFSPDGQHIVVSSENGDVTLLSLFDTSNEYTIRNKLTGHLATVFGAAFNHQSQLVATCGEDEITRVFDIDGDLVFEDASDLGQLFGLEFERTRNMLYVTGEEQSVYQYDMDKKQRIHKWKASNYTLYGVVTCPYRPDLVATYGADRTVKVWLEGRLLADLSGHKGSTMWACFHPSEPLIAVGCYDNSVWLWNFESGKPVSFANEQKPIYNIGFNHDGRLLIVTTTSGVLIKGIE